MATQLRLQIILALALTIATTMASATFYKNNQAAKSEDWDKPAFCQDLDCPEFDVIETNSEYEIRNYTLSYWVTSTTIGVSYDIASGLNFNRLFDYIDGNNVENKKIDMTAPVLTRVTPLETLNDETDYTTSFYVSPAQAPGPEPSDERVFLSTLPQQTVYVRSFSGFANGDDYVNAAIQLSEVLPEGTSYNRDSWYTAGYDSPYQPFNRHNEVWFIAV